MTSADRLRWVVDTLDPPADARVFELGGGGGAAAALLLERLAAGTYVGLDRSRLQVERAAKRNAAHVASGRARFVTGTLEEAGLPAASFDVAFASDVNVFWTTVAGEELRRLARLVLPGGSLHLFYEAFTAPAAVELEAKVRATFAAAALEPAIARADRRLHVRASIV